MGQFDKVQNGNKDDSKNEELGLVGVKENVIVNSEETEIKNAEMYEKKEAYAEAGDAYAMAENFEKAGYMYIKAAEKSDKDWKQKEKYYSSAGFNFKRAGKFIEAGDAYMSSSDYFYAKAAYESANYEEGVTKASKALREHFESKARN